MFTDSFTGIAPESLVGFVGAQLVGALLALVVVLPFQRAFTKESQ